MSPEYRGADARGGRVDDLTVRDAAGAVAAVVPKFFPATYHEQQAASVFLNGLPLPPGGSITAAVERGGAIVYAATETTARENPSLQIAARAPWKNGFGR